MMEQNETNITLNRKNISDIKIGDQSATERKSNKGKKRNYIMFSHEIIPCVYWLLFFCDHS